MMSSSTRLSSFIPRICHYQNDGMGRDLYISANNAGFYKDYRMFPQPRKREPFIIPRKTTRAVISKPLNRYSCDGNGRDLYVYRANSRNFNVGNSGIDIQDILRNEDVDLSPVSNGPLMQTAQQKTGFSAANKRIVDRLLNRIFYGKAEGVPDRRMSPKVQFNKKAYDISDALDSKKMRKSHELKPIFTQDVFYKGIRSINAYKRKFRFYRAYDN